MTYLTCPHCSSTQKHRTIDSRGIWRRHQCSECGDRFTSYAQVAPLRPEYQHRTPAKGQMSLGF